MNPEMNIVILGFYFGYFRMFGLKQIYGVLRNPKYNFISVFLIMQIFDSDRKYKLGQIKLL